MRDSGLSIHSLSKYSELYQIGEETLIERKEILMDEYQKLLKKQATINGTVAKLEKKIENYNYKIKQSSENLYTE